MWVDDLCALYASHLRGHLFSGFLSLSGFLLVLNWTLIIWLERIVYSTIEYEERYRDSVELGNSRMPYEPLRNMSQLGFISGFTALVTGVLQVTIGLCPSHWATFVCLAAASATILMALFYAYEVHRNLQVWLSYCEQKGFPKR